MEIKESDWRLFRKLRVLALERYCERILDEVVNIAEEDNPSYHSRYLKLWKLLRDRDGTIGIAFNDPKRSNAILQLVTIVAEGLLTDAELEQFSEDTRERVGAIRQIRDS